jgi:hypothetical protein
MYGRGIPSQDRGIESNAVALASPYARLKLPKEPGAPWLFEPLRAHHVDGTLLRRAPASLFTAMPRVPREPAARMDAHGSSRRACAQGGARRDQFSANAAGVHDSLAPVAR